MLQCPYPGGYDPETRGWAWGQPKEQKACEVLDRKGQIRVGGRGTSGYMREVGGEWLPGAVGGAYLALLHLHPSSPVAILVGAGVSTQVEDEKALGELVCGVERMREGLMPALPCSPQSPPPAPGEKQNHKELGAQRRKDATEPGHAWCSYLVLASLSGSQKGPETGGTGGQGGFPPA